MTRLSALLLAALSTGAGKAGAQQDGGLVHELAPRAGGASGRLAFEARPAPGEIRVDGLLDEPAWTAAQTIPLAWETAPGDNGPAPVDTECQALFDPERLYFACRAFDPEPGSIRAFITDRDDVDGHDRIVLSLDPFDDARRAFEFTVTALGVQGDATYDEQTGTADDSWDAIWQSAGRLTEDGYVIELSIPFRSLRFPDIEGIHRWGFHARRWWPRSNRVEVRSMRWDRGNACMLCQANHLTGIREVSPGLNVEVTPTLTARRADRRPLEEPEFRNGAIEPEPGLDLRWSPTSDLALNLTANPDFSQVEADAPQVEVNNRFALFFPEKRPFFLEGADFFSTPLQAVFTRTVADPLGGAKATGKIGGNAVGAMVTLDRVNNLIFPGNQGSASVALDDRVTGAVGRFRRDIGASSTVGGLYTGRLGSDYANHVVGTDAFFRPLPALSVRAQLLHSETRYPDPVATANAQPRGHFGGDAASLRAQFSNREWRLFLVASALSPGFRADAGFIPQVDNRGLDVWGSRHFFPDGGFFSRIGGGAGGWHYEDWEGRLTGEGVWLNASFDGPWQSNVWVNPNWIRRWFDGATYDVFELWGGASLRPTGNLRLGVDGLVGDGIDFRNGRKGRQLRVSPLVELRAGRHVDLRLSASLQRMTHVGDEVFTALVSQVRAVYNLDPRTFVRVLLQYRDTDRSATTNPGLETLEDRGLSTRVLFSYKLNPLTVLFVGYSDDRRGEDPVDGAVVPLTQTERAFFVKLGYAWRP